MYCISTDGQPALVGPLATGLGEGLMTCCKIQYVTKCYNKLQTGKDS